MPKQYRDFLSDLKNRQSEDSALLSKVVAHLEGVEELEDVQVQLVPKDIADYFCLTETPGSGRLMGVDEIPSIDLSLLLRMKRVHGRCLDLFISSFSQCVVACVTT